MPPIAVERPQNIPLGIILMLVGVLLYSVNDLFGKYFAGTYSAPQILLFRSIAALIILAPVILRSGVLRLFAVSSWRAHALRAAMAAGEVCFFYWSVRYLPLADAMTFYMAGPIYVTLMAALFLNERVGWRRWTAVGLGFLGVVVALGPSVANHGWPVFIALAGSIIYAGFLVMTRTMRGTPDTTLVTWQTIASLIVGIVGAPLFWTPLASPVDGFYVACLGVASLAGAVCVNRSLAIAPASVVVPYQYTMILWAIMFGYFFFGDKPTVPMVAGAGIIIAAGLFIFFRERQVGAPLPQEEVAPER